MLALDESVRPQQKWQRAPPLAGTNGRGYEGSGQQVVGRKTWCTLMMSLLYQQTHSTRSLKVRGPVVQGPRSQCERAIGAS